MSVIHNDLLLSTDEATGYNLTNSLRFRSSASAYLSRTPSSTGNRRTWTYSVWFKRGALGGSTTKNLLTAYVGSGSSVDTIDLYNDNIRFFFNGSSSSYLVTSQVLRDPSAWYHLVASVDTTQATSSNRMKLYINGVQVTSFSSATYPTQNYDTFVNLSSYPHIIGNSGFASDYYDGYITEAIIVDGQALTPSSFGENNADTGVWQPIRYTGTYGTNGFYLPFTDVATTSGSNAGLGKDFSGNGNYWTTNNISVTAGATYDSMTDVPTLTSATAANYCVLNPLNSTATIADGNLKSSAGASYIDALATIECSAGAGKWYFEATLLSLTNTYAWVGVTKSSNSGLNHTAVDSYRTIYQANGYVYREGTGIGDTNTGTTYTTNDVIGIALDSVTGSISFYKNNTLVNTTTNSVYSSNSFFFYTGQNASSWALNFGQQGFKYTPPTGYVALNTYNL